MSKSSRRAKDRRKSVLNSLEKKPSGGLTTYAAELMFARRGGTAAVCTISHYCQTTVFKYPGCHLTSEKPDVHEVICEDEAFRAAVVSDLTAYFQENPSGFPHYAIDVSLRDGVDRVCREKAGQEASPNVPIFLVIEQYESVPATTFESGECFLIDEYRDGQAVIEGGREGERALLVVRTINGAWPDFSPTMQAVNTVLAAVKVEQDVTRHIDELYSCSCFVSDDRQAVYTFHPTMNIGYCGANVSSTVVDAKGLRDKVTGVRSIYDGLRRDSVTMPQVAELVDSVLLDNTQDDRYFRLWYLRLWQAVVDAKRLLGQPKFEDDPNTIAGKLTPKKFKQHRHNIAHWWTGKVDFSFVTGIQQTVLELLRRKYRRGTP